VLYAVIMNARCYELAGKLVGDNYVKQGEEALKGLTSKITVLLEQKKLPPVGWEEQDITQFLSQLSAMDSNNFQANCGVGEREGRVYSGIVRRRHFGLSHGVGRSGDLTAVQPKAAGSSIITKLTNSMLLDIIKLSGVNSVKAAFLVPMATGMCLALSLLSFRSSRPNAKFVIWSRIDQKSCFKSILTAGFTPIVVELRKVGDELTTDVEKIESTIEEYGAENILALFTTTSCFAPRGPDDIPAVAKLAAAHSIPHIVNNAYGLQSSKCAHLLTEGARVGRVDFFVQSTDKNLMVPVGGAIIAGFDAKQISELSQTYPGRASASPAIDVFVTLLSMGVEGYKTLLKDRKENFEFLREELRLLAGRQGEGVKVQEVKSNTISVAISIPQEGRDASALGAMLFTRGVSGTRVITGQENKSIGGVPFLGWGSHTNHCSSAYLTAAASVGMEQQEVVQFIKRLDKVLDKIKTEQRNREILTKKTNELML